MEGKGKAPQLGGQWKENEKLPMLGGQWKENENSFPPLFIFPPTNFTQTFIFSFDLKLLLYHSSRSLLMHFPTFP
jgi:hypothetical protein